MQNNEDPSVVSKKPGLLHAFYNLRSLPLMTDITKHVRRLMLKDLCTGGEESCPAWGGINIDSLFVVHTHTLQMSIIVQLLVLFQLLL